MKAGTHSPFGERSHTTAHTAKQEPSLHRPQRGFALPVKSLLFRHAFIYIHFPVLCDPPLSATVVSQTISHPVFQLLLQTVHVCLHSRKRVHSPSPTGSHTAAYTVKQGAFRMGRYHYPRTVSHVLETLRGQVSEQRNLPLWDLGRVCSRRTQKAFGTATRMSASLSRRRRGPAGLRCSVCNLVMLLFFHSVRSTF